MRSSDFVNVISAGLSCDVFPCLWANPGCGKSEFLKAFARAEGYELIHINCYSLESTDLVLPSIVGSVVEYIPRSWIDKSLKATKPLIIFLDEVNRIKPENVNLLTTLVLEKEVYGHRLPASTKFVAAANFSCKCSSALKLDSAVMSRFCHLLFDIPLVDSLPFMGSDLAQEFIVSNMDLIKESAQDRDFVNEVLEELEVNRRSLTWCLRMFEQQSLDAGARRAVAQGLLGVPEGSKIAAAYEDFISKRKRVFPSKIAGNEDELEVLLNQGHVSEVTALVQASLQQEKLAKDAVKFIVSRGNPELVRNIIITNKNISAFMLEKADLDSLGIPGITETSMTMIEVIIKYTSLLNPS